MVSSQTPLPPRLELFTTGPVFGVVNNAKVSKGNSVTTIINDNIKAVSLINMLFLDFIIIAPSFC